MTDRITATRAVIEAAKAFDACMAEFDDPAYCGESLQILGDAIDTYRSAESPDLDAKIAEVLPCNCGWVDQGPVHSPGCTALKRHAVRDLIVALLASHQGEWSSAALQAADGAGFERAREQAAKLFDGDPTLVSEMIRAMESKL